ncbi:hypothetical protein ABGB17_28590 [Sphaerisporangium sp. B11E5]|uniref:hypothetical protein n=1 Tax=Sphaerisporangium sp. B11E5 TaxID=3153563 RepID=UPI00325C5A50
MRTADIDRLVASLAPGTGPGLTPGARELLDEIVATSQVPVRPRPALTARLARLAPLVRHRLLAPLTVAVVLLTWTLPGGLGPGLGPRPTEALEINRSGVYFSVVVKDVYADKRSYRRELAAHGVPLSMVVVPGRPGSVGQVVVVTGGPLGFTRSGKVWWTVPDRRDIAPLPVAAYCDTAEHCPIGMLVRAGYQNRGTVWVARRALPGENYVFPTRVTVQPS